MPNSIPTGKLNVEASANCQACYNNVIKVYVKYACAEYLNWWNNHKTSVSGQTEIFRFGHFQELCDIFSKAGMLLEYDLHTI